MKSVTHNERRKLSHVFHVCYAELCKRQNMQPLSVVSKITGGGAGTGANSGGGTGKHTNAVLDLAGDRVKFEEWGPILNALSIDNSLHYVAVRCRQHPKQIYEHLDNEIKLRQLPNNRSPLATKFILTCIVEALVALLAETNVLAVLELEGLVLSPELVTLLTKGIAKNKTLQHLSLKHCLIGNEGCDIICKTLKHVSNIVCLNLSNCNLSHKGVMWIAEMVKYQKISRYSESWKQTLRYREPDMESMRGLRRLTINNNTEIGDEGFQELIDVIQDDLWLKALDLQNCGISDAGAKKVTDVLTTFNGTLDVVDLRRNPGIATQTLQTLMLVLCRDKACRPEDCDYSNVSRYPWLNAEETQVSMSSRGTTTAGSKTLVSKKSNTVVLQQRRAASEGAPVLSRKNSLRDVWTPIKPLNDGKPAVAEQLKLARMKISELQEQLESSQIERRQVDELNEQLHSQLMETMRRGNASVTLPGYNQQQQNQQPCHHQQNVNHNKYQCGGDPDMIPVQKDVLNEIYTTFNEIVNVLPQQRVNGVIKNRHQMIGKLQSIIEESPPSTRDHSVCNSKATSPRESNKNNSPVLQNRKQFSEKRTKIISDTDFGSNNIYPSETPSAIQLFENLLMMENEDDDDEYKTDYESDEDQSYFSSGRNTVRFTGSNEVQ